MKVCQSNLIFQVYFTYHISALLSLLFRNYVAHMAVQKGQGKIHHLESCRVLNVNVTCVRI